MLSCSTIARSSARCISSLIVLFPLLCGSTFAAGGCRFGALPGSPDGAYCSAVLHIDDPQSSAGASRIGGDDFTGVSPVLRLRPGGVSCHHPNHLFTRVSNRPQMN